MKQGTSITIAHRKNTDIYLFMLSLLCWLKYITFCSDAFLWNALLINISVVTVKCERCSEKRDSD